MLTHRVPPKLSLFDSHAPRRRFGFRPKLFDRIFFSSHRHLRRRLGRPRVRLGRERAEISPVQHRHRPHDHQTRLHRRGPRAVPQIAGSELPPRPRQRRSAAAVIVRLSFLRAPVGLCPVRVRTRRVACRASASSKITETSTRTRLTRIRSTVISSHRTI